MSIYTPEIATVYGALDSDAFVDGAPFAAHKLRALTMSGNRLVSKARNIVTMAWPQTDTSGDENGVTWGMASAKAWPWWTRVLLPVVAPKPPGLNRASVWIRAKITSGFSCSFALESRVLGDQAGLLPLDHPNVVTVTGTGSYQNIEIDGAILSDSTQETIGLWAQGVPQAVDNEAAFGAPYTGTITQPSDEIGIDFIVDQAANWNTSLAFPSTEDYANGGHMVQFEVSGTYLSTPRQVVLVDSPVMLSFWPPLTPGEVSRANRGADYTLLQVPRVSIACLTVAAQSRST